VSLCRDASLVHADSTSHVIFKTINLIVTTAFMGVVVVGNGSVWRRQCAFSCYGRDRSDAVFWYRVDSAAQICVGTDSGLLSHLLR